MKKFPEHGFASRLRFFGDPRKVLFPQEKLLGGFKIQEYARKITCGCTLMYSIPKKSTLLTLCHEHRISFTERNIDIGEPVERILR